MKIYDVSLLDEDRLPGPRRLLTFAVFLPVGLAIYFTLEWLSPDRTVYLLWPGHRVGSMVLKALIMCLPLSVFASWYGTTKKFRLTVTEPWQAYQIILEEDQIRTRNFNSYNRMLSKVIYRDTVRTIVEKEKGLLISSRDRLGTFLCGGIWIPKRLTDYEDLKHLLSSWKVKEAV